MHETIKLSHFKSGVNIELKKYGKIFIEMYKGNLTIYTKPGSIVLL